MKITKYTRYQLLYVLRIHPRTFRYQIYTPNTTSIIISSNINFAKSNITQNVKLLNDNNDSTSTNLNCINENQKRMEYIPTVPKGKTIITNKWIFSVKKDSNNKIYKFNLRLVARGFCQKYGIDFELTYSPTLNIDGLKFKIALAAKFQWNIFQLDIKSAYLNAPLDEEIFTTIPPGDPNYNKGFWRLKKAFYGLKQSG